MTRTETRCGSITFFSKVSLSTPPTSHQVVKVTPESIVRKLAFKKTSKNPLLKEHVNRIVQYFLQRNTIQDHWTSTGDEENMSGGAGVVRARRASRHV
jgi:hypothetical protein